MQVFRTSAVIRVQFGNHIGLEIFKSANLREIARVNKPQPGQRAYGNRGKQQQDKSNAPYNLATPQV